MNKDLLYYIPTGEFGKEGVLSLLKTHPEIRFVSLVGIDLAGNDTDEKVPIELFLKNYDDFFAGTAVQTDGSSVVLMNIATLNDARVDMVADPSVNWYIDYNEDNIYENGRPVGTLRIPCFLLHNGKFIDSRSILKDSCAFVADKLKGLLAGGKKVKGMEDVPFEDIEDIEFTIGTELVAYWFKHDRTRIAERLGKLGIVYQEIKSAQSIKNWNSGKLQVALIHPASAGHGLNLQSGGNFLVWFGLTWSLELYSQTNARLWRQGQQSETVIIQHIVTKGTVDEKILKALKEKDETQSALMTAVKAELEEI